MDNFVTDNLLDPNGLDKNGRSKKKVQEQKRINVAQDGLMERKAPAAPQTEDGRSLLKEQGNKNLL